MPRGCGWHRICSPLPGEAEYVVEIVTPDHMAELIVATIVSSAKTGRIGDGKIFVLPIEDAVRIRTGERGDEAI